MKHLPARTLWSSSPDLDREMFEFTAGEDRLLDARLLRWDILGSLGHVAVLRASGLLTERDFRRLRGALRSALAAQAAGKLRIGSGHEDVHSAVEDWLSNKFGNVGAMIHTGRSRNDQVVCDLRLFLKDKLLAIQSRALALVSVLLAFAARHEKIFWPGYTHTRRAMPSSAGLWAAAHAEGLLDTAESLPSLWAQLDRSPLGSAAGYGVPLPLNREAAAKALGFAGPEHNVAAVQNGRGKLEAAALFWAVQLGHDMAKLSADVILYSAEEFGFLKLPASLATGSSIMPQKRNPDLFELTRGRAAAVDGDLFTVMQIRGKLGGGYHRDFQLLKEPLLRGLDRTEASLAMLAAALPRLAVDKKRCHDSISGDLLATDAVMRRVESGVPFRIAYRAVAAELKSGEEMPVISRMELIARRRSTGNIGNLGLPAVRARLAATRRGLRRERNRFDNAMRRLAG